MIGAIIGALAVIGLLRVCKLALAFTRRALGRMGRALASLDMDAWYRDVATDATVIDPSPRKGRKVRA